MVLNCSMLICGPACLLLARWAWKEAHGLQLSANLAQMRIARPKAQAVHFSCRKEYTLYSELTGLT
jgi:hypothetical protein